MDDTVLFSRPKLANQPPQPLVQENVVSQEIHPTTNVPSSQTIPEATVPTEPRIPNNPPTSSGSSALPPQQPPPPPSQSLGRGIGRILPIVLGVFVFIILLVVGVLVFLPKKSTEPVKITYWGLWEDPKAVQVIISDFEKKNPLIKVEYVKQDIKQYRERLASRIPAGNGPDVFYFHNTWTNMLGSLLTPIPSDVMTPAAFRDTYYPVMEYDLIRQGAIYGIPLGTDALSLFVNTDLLKAGGVDVPENWDDFDKAAKKLTVKDETGKIQTAGAALGTVDNVTHAYDLISLLFVQNGVNLPTISQNPTGASEALEFYTQYASTQDATWDTTLDPSLLAFANGKLAFYFGYSWDVFNIKQLNPSLPFSIHAVPSLPSRVMSITSYWAAGASVKSSHQKEATQFLKYLSEKETAQKLYKESAKIRGFGMPYPHKSLAKSLENDPIVGPFVSQSPYVYSTYFASETYDDGVNTKLNGYLGNAVREIGAGTQPDAAVEKFLEGVAQVQAEYGI